MTLAAGLRTHRRFRTAPRLSRSTLALASGLVCALATVFAAGELYLRVAPPGDLTPYLPGADREGPFRADAKYGVQYRSLEGLAADNPGRFEPYRPLLNNPQSPPIWAFFGSSFAQAPGMLADTARRYVPQRFVFNLGKNEQLPVRLAQAEFLLDAGLKPERLFLVFIPLDVFQFAQHGLDQYRATPGGAIAYEPRLPAFGGTLVRHSRLALKGWTRTTLHLNRPFLSASSLHDRVDDAMRADIRTIFGHFAQAATRHHIPVTVVLLPDYEQVTRGAHFAVQETLAEDARSAGFDVCDVRAAFLAWPNRPELFIPDKHFSEVGNRLLLAEILAHLKAADLPRAANVRP